MGDDDEEEKECDDDDEEEKECDDDDEEEKQPGESSAAVETQSGRCDPEEENKEQSSSTVDESEEDHKSEESEEDHKSEESEEEVKPRKVATGMLTNTPSHEGTNDINTALGSAFNSQGNSNSGEGDSISSGRKEPEEQQRMEAAENNH